MKISFLNSAWLALMLKGILGEYSPSKVGCQSIKGVTDKEVYRN
jgi:hypothetical protein